MKVLQVNCVYKKGSTGKITYDLHSGLIGERNEVGCMLWAWRTCEGTRSV